MRHLLALLVVCWPSLLLAQEDGALSVRIDEGIAGEISFNVSFTLILTNNTNETIRVWNPESKDGYYQISFVFMDKKTREEFRVQKRKVEDPEDWQFILSDSTPKTEILEIAPRQGLELSVRLEEDWGGLPDPNQDRSYRVWASFQSDTPAPEGEKSVWNGTVGSFPVNTNFKATRLTPWEDYLEYGFTDTAIKLIISRGTDSLEDDYNDGYTVLQYAAFHAALSDRLWKKRDWKKIVDTYLELGANYDIESAIYLNDIDRVKAILKVSPNQANGILLERSNPLRIAALTGNLEICRYLVENFDVDVNDWEAGLGYPILKDALKYPKIVKLLIDHGADLKTRISWEGGRSGNWLFEKNATALHYAVLDGPIETVKILLDSGIDIAARSESSVHRLSNPTAVHLANGKVTELIVNHPRFAELDNQARQSLLNECLVSSTSDSFEAFVFLNAGADPNSEFEGVSAVQAAAISRIRYIDYPELWRRETFNEAAEIVKLLRKHGAKIDLFTAVVIGDEKDVARLLKESPQSLISYNVGGLLLHAAVKVQNVAIIKQLLKAGADFENEKKEVWFVITRTAIDVAKKRSKDTRDDPNLHGISEQILELLEQAATQK